MHNAAVASLPLRAPPGPPCRACARRPPARAPCARPRPSAAGSWPPPGAPCPRPPGRRSAQVHRQGQEGMGKVRDGGAEAGCSPAAPSGQHPALRCAALPPTHVLQLLAVGRHKDGADARALALGVRRLRRPDDVVVGACSSSRRRRRRATGQQPQERQSAVGGSACRARQAPNTASADTVAVLAVRLELRAERRKTRRKTRRRSPAFMMWLRWPLVTDSSFCSSSLRVPMQSMEISKGCKRGDKRAAEERGVSHSPARTRRRTAPNAASESCIARQEQQQVLPSAAASTAPRTLSLHTSDTSCVV